MFHTELTHYLNLTADPLVVGTKSEYEFTMAALYIGSQWYVLIENPDLTRIADIDEVIKDEFDADVLGWCLLKKYQARDTVIPFAQGDQRKEHITLRQDARSIWLLQIQPRVESRLQKYQPRD